MLEVRKKRSQTQNKTSFGNCFQNHNNENKFDNKKKEENVMLLESMICLFSNMGNDLFLSAESKKEEISNSKTSF